MRECCRQLRQPRALPLGQIRAHLEDEIAIRKASSAASSASTSAAMRSQSRAELQDVAARHPQHFGGLPRHAARKQAGDFRRRHEVAVATHLGRTGAVVAEARRVQRQAHVGIEADDAALRRDEFADVRRHALGMRALDVTQLRQGCEGSGRSHRVHRCRNGTESSGQDGVDHRRRAACRRGHRAPLHAAGANLVIHYRKSAERRRGAGARAQWLAGRIGRHGAGRSAGGRHACRRWSNSRCAASARSTC